MSVEFPELYKSAFGKAIKISPTIMGVTLGPEAEHYNLHDESPGPGFLPKTSTPRRYMGKLASVAMRRPHRASSIVEIRSDKGILQKKLLAEISWASQRSVNLVNSNLEEKALAHQEATLNRLAHQNFVYNAQRKSKSWELENKFLINAPIKEEIMVSETEDDKLAASRAQQRRDKLRQNVEELGKRRMEKRKQLEAIIDAQTTFSSVYKSILDMIGQCQDVPSLRNAIASSLISVDDDAKILESFHDRLDDLTSDDIKATEVILRNIRSVHGMVRNEIQRINDMVAERKRLEKEKAEAEKIAAKKAEEEKSISATEEVNLTDCFDSQSIETYTECRRHLNEVKKTLEPILSNETMKKFKFDLQKAVTTPVNAISPVSSEHMLDKYRKLHHLLSGQRVDVGGVSIAANDHPLGPLLCKEILAKVMVRQGDMTVSSKPDAAFALASILVNLWTEFPDFGKLVLCHFQEKCPYLAPVFLPQMDGQTNLEYYQSLGYQCYGDEIEKQDKFLKRMKGVMRLYAAILITKPRNGKPNPLGIKEAWRWLAAILNKQPRPDICAVLILELLKVAGNELLQAYRGQFKKMLAYICQEYFPRLEKVTAASTGGPLTRLELFLQNVGTEGTIHPPPKILPQNFW